MRNVISFLKSSFSINLASNPAVQVHFSVSLCLQLPCDVAQTHSELTVDILNVSLDSTESYLDEQYLTSEIISLTSFSFGVCLPPERVILFVGISWENSANLGSPPTYMNRCCDWLLQTIKDNKTIEM